MALHSFLTEHYHKLLAYISQSFFNKCRYEYQTTTKISRLEGYIAVRIVWFDTPILSSLVRKSRRNFRPPLCDYLARVRLRSS